MIGDNLPGGHGRLAQSSLTPNIVVFFYQLTLFRKGKKEKKKKDKAMVFAMLSFQITRTVEQGAALIFSDICLFYP